MPGNVRFGIRAPCARLADLVGIEVAVQGEPLAAETARDVEQHVFIAIVAVGHRPVGIDARGGSRDAEARDRAAAADAEAPLVVAAAFGQQVELRRRFRPARVTKLMTPLLAYGP